MNASRVARLSFSLALGGSIMLAGAGCGMHHHGAQMPGAAATTQVSLTDAGCSPRTLSVPAGPREFTVHNADAAAVTEIELKQSGRILGEVENITPGLRGSFSLVLVPGIYQLSCPGGSGADAKLVVSPAAHAAPVANSKNVSRAVATYRAYLIAQTDLLARRTHAFADAVTRGDRDGAKALYARTRMPYESIEPVAEQFADLDKALDARANDVEPAQWSGFHRIELVLWSKRSMTEAAPYALKLDHDVADLQVRVRDLPLQPAQIANGAVDLLDEVAKTKVTGEEERYSHTDLADMRANVAGSRAAYDAVAPILRSSDPELARTLQARFATLDMRMAQYARGDDHFVAYDELTQRDVRLLSAAVDALAEPLSQVARRVVTVS